MPLVTHISPRVARRLHEAGLLTDLAKAKLERRSRLVRRIWIGVAVAFGLAVLGQHELLQKPNPVKPSISSHTQRQASS